MMFDESHSTVEIKLPDGVREEQVSILAEFCDQFNQVDRWAEKHTLKEAEKVQSRRETQREARKEPETITAPFDVTTGLISGCAATISSMTVSRSDSVFAAAARARY